MKGFREISFLSRRRRRTRRAYGEGRGGEGPPTRVPEPDSLAITTSGSHPFLASAPGTWGVFLVPPETPNNEAFSKSCGPVPLNIPHTCSVLPTSTALSTVQYQRRCDGPPGLATPLLPFPNPSCTGQPVKSTGRTWLSGSHAFCSPSPFAAGPVQLKTHSNTGEQETGNTQVSNQHGSV